MTTPEANQHVLARLASVIRRRYGGEPGREFFVLAAVTPRRRASTDELVTQPMRILRAG